MAGHHPAERYDRIASRFDECVRAVPASGWDVPTVCAGWKARDVVDHLVTWVPGFFASQAGIELSVPVSAAFDPAQAWTALDVGLRGWLSDSAMAAKTFAGPMGPTTVAEAVDQFVTSDLLVHTWDLARATGCDDRLDEAEVAAMLAGIEPMDEPLRASGHYGPKVEVPAGASVQDRLLGFLGRDPTWRPS